MKKIFFVMILMFVFTAASGVCASDWKALGDSSVSLTPAEIACLERKQAKTIQDVYILTIFYYRNYDTAGLKKLLGEQIKDAPAGSAACVLKAIVLMKEHRHQESRNLLAGVLTAHPDFHPARIVLAHLCYLQKDFTQSYALARQLMAKKEELSRYHYVVSLLLAAGAKGILTKKNSVRAIGAYFEVNGYLKEAKKIMPDAPEVLYGLGSYYLLTPAVAGGNLDRAMQLLEKSRQLTPLNPNVYLRLAQAHSAKGDSAQYRKNIDRASELDCQDELLLDYLSGEKAFLDVP